MNNPLVISLISASGSIFVAALSYWFTKQRERDAEWRKQKLEHYRSLMVAISGVVKEHATVESYRVYADASNVIGLVASQDVVQRLQDFRHITRSSNPNVSMEEHDRALTALVLSIRRDLGVSPKDDPSTFKYILWAMPSEPNTT